MASKLSRICDGLLEAGWLAALISVPLFFNIHSERVFEPDKVAILRSIAVLLFVALLVKGIDQFQRFDRRRLHWRHGASIWRMPFVLPIAALTSVYLISTLLSITPRISWLGSYQRSQGTYTMLAYILFFVAGASAMRNRNQVSRIPTAIIIASIPVAFYGLLQHFGHDPLPWGGDVQERIAGHMGNAIFISAYLIMAIPITIGRIIDAFSNILGDEHLSVSDIVRSSLYFFALALQLLAVYWSGSRGPMIGLAMGLFSFGLVLLVSLRNSVLKEGELQIKDGLYAFLLTAPPFAALFISGLVGDASSASVSLALFLSAVSISLLLILVLVVMRKGWKWLWLSWLLLTVLVAGWLLLFNLSSDRLSRLSEIPIAGNMFEEQIDWKDLPNVGSYGRMLDPTISSGREKSNRVRVLIWEGVVELISPHSPLSYPNGEQDTYNFWRPLFGYGPESMYVAYNRFYPPELATVEARNASPDRSHNETFDAFVITGLAGFFAWQILYISVFYYGFSYLGVVGSRRDSVVLIGSWIGGALVGALLSVTALDPIYLGVTIPLGTIFGLVLYLFYYAISSRPKQSADGVDRQGVSAFQTDHLLINALLAAVLAHYVEVHFGIAIVSTRLEFFLIVAMVFVEVYKLPQWWEVAQEALSRGKGAGKSAPVEANQSWVAILPWAFLLALMIGTLGFGFVNYVVPSDKVIKTGADLVASDIFRQSLFVRPDGGFGYSPFVFLLIVLSWVTGILIVLSEMIRQNDFEMQLTNMGELLERRQRLAALGYLVVGILGLVQRFLAVSPQTPTANLAGSLFLLVGVICLFAAWGLFRDASNGRPAAILVATAGLILVFPIMISGSVLIGLVLVVLSALFLYLLWDPALKNILLSILSLAAISFVVGMLYTFFQAFLLREALLFLVFLQGIEPISPWYGMLFAPSGKVTTVMEARVLEAAQAMRFLSAYFVFLFSMIMLAGFALARPHMAKASSWGRAAAYGTGLLALLLGIMIVSQTNVRPVQADMVFKRGRPFDEQALRSQDPRQWDAAIAIYEEAINLAPMEDYYYLFLGRAYLERAALAETEEERSDLLTEAEERLLFAREINPLNTDHSANLARLKTRTAVAAGDALARDRQLEEAESYYQDALRISPQNSVIRNELARLTFDLRGDCEKAMELLEQSLTIDPFYTETYFVLADVLTACAAAQEDREVEEALYRNAIEILDRGLNRDPEQARAWLQAGLINQRLSRFEDSLAAFEQVRELSATSGIPSWNIDFYEADAYREMGNTPMARALAEQALQTAPANTAAQIQDFLDALERE